MTRGGRGEGWGGLGVGWSRCLSCCLFSWIVNHGFGSLGSVASGHRDLNLGAGLLLSQDASFLRLSRLPDSLDVIGLLIFLGRHGLDLSHWLIVVSVATTSVSLAKWMLQSTPWPLSRRLIDLISAAGRLLSQATATSISFVGASIPAAA